MKVGILTFHWANNYGALFQAYCLCAVVRNLHHEVNIIDYVPPGSTLRWWQGWGLHTGTPSLALKRLRFDEFRRRDVPLTRRCRTMDELRSVANEFDIVIVGSDQVWNGHIVSSTDLPYFLGVVAQEHRRLVSYAATFGEPNQPMQTISRAGPLLRRFNHISVRDKMTASLVRELSGRDSDIVLDPTLIHDYRDVVARDDHTPGYIAVYFISHGHINLGRAVVHQVRTRLGLPAVTIGEPRNILNSDRHVLSAGPSEWLRLLQGAAFICTDSFHGSALAIKSAKPFIAWPGLRPERLQSLLGVCGIPNRLIETADSAYINALVETNTDYRAVSERLSPLVASSRAFLERALTQQPDGSLTG